MGLYLDNKKRKIYLNGQAYAVNLAPKIPANVLRSSDGYILKDSNGLFLTVKVGE